MLNKIRTGMQISEMAYVANQMVNSETKKNEINRIEHWYYNHSRQTADDYKIAYNTIKRAIGA